MTDVLESLKYFFSSLLLFKPRLYENKFGWADLKKISSE